MIKLITILTLLFFSLATHAQDNEELEIQADGSSYDVILNELEFKAEVERNYPECGMFLDNYPKPLEQGKLRECLIENRVLTPTIVAKILAHQPPVSKEFIDEALEIVLISTMSTPHIKAIKKLINAGASTEKFNAEIHSGNDIACEVVSVVIKKNKEFYKDEKLLSIKRDGYHSRWLDLHYLTNTVTEYNLCNKAATLLVGINPKLINYQKEDDKSTPLHNYLYDVNYSHWEMGVAKLLMSKENINLQTKWGDTALHYLLLYNKESTAKLIELLKNALSLGADLTLKNEEGITVKELIMKQPDLVSVLK